MSFLRLCRQRARLRALPFCDCVGRGRVCAPFLSATVSAEGASARPSLSTLFDYWSACMATAASPRQMMYAQIMSQPALLLEVFDATERMVQDAFSHLQPQRWQAIYTAGCGHCFFAGLPSWMDFCVFFRT